MIFAILLPIHILIALSSVFYTLYILFKPSQKGLNLSYALVGLTLATGTVLVLLKPQHLTSTCIEGLVYVILMLIGIFAIRHKISETQVDQTTKI